MAVETTTVNICDRCGSRHNAADYMAGSTWGQLTLKWHGDIGGRAYDGAAGGANIKGTAWICHPCTEAFLAFLKPATSTGGTQQDFAKHLFNALYTMSGDSDGGAEMMVRITKALAISPLEWDTADHFGMAELGVWEVGNG